WRGSRARYVARHLSGRASRAAAPARNRAAIHRQQTVIGFSFCTGSCPASGGCLNTDAGIVLCFGQGRAENSRVARKMKRMAGSIRMVIADDHPLFRGALREAVSGLFAGGENAEAGSLQERTSVPEPR